jgi:hypothetical protein
MAIAEQDSTALIQALLGAITGKDVATSGGKSTTGSTDSIQQILQQLLQTSQSQQSQTSTQASQQSGVQNTNQQSVQNTNQQATQNINQNQATSGSSVTTTGSNITDEGMQHIINQILGGQGGVADIASGKNIAGIYNDTTTTLLLNDLITKTAGQLAAQKAGTTSTTVNSGNVATTGQNVNNVVGAVTNALTGQTNTQNNATVNGLVNTNTNASSTQNSSGTTNTGVKTTGGETFNSNQKTTSPLGSIDWSALGGAAGIGALIPLLGPSVSAGLGNLPGGGLSGAGNALRDLLFGGSGGIIDPTGQGNGASLTPQQIEAMVGPDFWQSIGIDPTTLGSITDTGDTGSWWDPSYDTEVPLP